MLKRITDLLSANQLMRNISAMVSGNAAARVVGVLALPVITRVYSPGDFGELAVFVATLGILLPFVTLRFSVAIPLPKRDGTAVNLFALCLALTITSTILATSAFGLISLNQNQLDIGVVSQYWWALALGLLGSGLYEIMSSWAIRRSQLAPVAKTMIYQSVGSAGSKILIGLLGFKPAGLIIGHIIGLGLGSLSLAKRFGGDLRLGFKRVSISRIRFVARKYSEFPKFRLPSQFLLAVSAQTPILFAASIFGDDVTGQLSLALVVVGLPITLLGKAVGQSFYAEIAALGVDRAAEVKAVCKMILRQMIMLMSILLVVLLVWSPWIFEVVFGENWRPAGEFTRILAVYMAAQLCALPLMNVFNLFGGQFTYLLVNSVRVLLIIGVFGSAMILNFDATTTIMLFSGVLSLYFVALIRKVFLTVK